MKDASLELTFLTKVRQSVFNDQIKIREIQGCEQEILPEKDAVREFRRAFLSDGSDCWESVEETTFIHLTFEIQH